MRRDNAKKLLMKLQLEEKGIVMNVRSKKKRFCDGFIRVIDKPTKKKKPPLEKGFVPKLLCINFD